ncbi:hypothetical protein MLD38_012406 [Melastoma candidum]|uniref:Uncharacterized protein n=1 Tax=Melastoma candidum TaxID=119954 RepID=A0ACB9R6T0_9MYRT|nr:hypothetical protein MLD38_012406 [Melastoma candidum]
MRECLRSLKRNPKGDDGSVRRAYQTLLKIIGNVVRNPDEDKFRTIRLANPVFQDRVRSFDEGMGFLQMCGFEITEDGEFLHLPRNRVDKGLLNLAGLQLQSASTNPFFGLLERPN